MAIMICLVACNTDNTKDFMQRLRTTLVADENTGEYSARTVDAVFDIIRNTPQAIDFNAGEIEAVGRLWVTTSTDSAVRAYTIVLNDFDKTPSGGLDARTLLQYRLNGEIYTAEYGERDSYPLQVVHFDNDRCMIVTYGGCTSQGERFCQSAQMLSMRNDGVHDAGSTFVIDGASQDTLRRGWDDDFDINEDDPAGDMNFLDRRLGESQGGISMWYNRFDSTLYVRDIITVNEDGIEKPVRGKTFRRLKWNDDAFNDITIMEPYEVKNDNYYLRLTQSPDGTCTYASWNKPLKDGAPALTLYEGTRQFWIVPGGLIDYNQWVTDDETPISGQKFTFVNNGFKYEYFTGYIDGMTMECLNVTDPRGNLIYSGDFNR